MSDPPATIARSSLDYLPVGLFGATMGLTGLSAVWHLAQIRYGIVPAVAAAIRVVALMVFVATAAAYARKWRMCPQAVKAEFHHPISGNMFGTFFVSLLLLPFDLAPISLLISRVLWGIGAIGMVVFSLVIITRWLSARQQPVSATPAWTIPVIGLLDIPLAVPILGLPGMHNVMVLGLAVGLFFSTPLFTVIFQRLLFEAPMADSLKPSLMILVAPPAVGFSTYVATTGRTDLFAQSLYWLTLFMSAALLGQLRHLPACCPFRVSWWAVSFPLAACAIAALKYAIEAPGWITDGIAVTLLAFVTLVIAGLLIRTAVGIARGELRTLSTY